MSKRRNYSSDVPWRCPTSTSYSVGQVEVLLPLESEEAAVRQFFKDGIEGLYRANYLLYRSTYLVFKRILKQHGVKEPNLSERMKHFAEC